MSRGKKYRPEEIIPKLREAEVPVSQGMTQEFSPWAEKEQRTTAARSCSAMGEPNPGWPGAFKKPLVF